MVSTAESWCHKDKRPIKVFFEDEARFGRINTFSRCWVPCRQRAEIDQQLVREYTYAYSAVCPATGETYSIISPLNNTAAMNAFLQMFTDQYKQNRIILILDGAAWHRSKELSLPENIKLLFLPAYSPQLNPVEHIWDYIREQKQFNNYTFNSLEEVEQRLENTLSQLHQEKEIVSSLCNFNWINKSVLLAV